MAPPDGDSTRLGREDFGFEVPDALVAQQPIDRRDQARLLVRQADGSLSHRMIPDLTSELPAGSLLILNDSRVIPSRLFGKLPSGGRVEVFLLKRGSGQQEWEALGRPLRKLRPGLRITFPGDMVAHCLERREESVSIRFETTDEDFESWINTHGLIPLPPYIRRESPQAAPVSTDRDRYQTVYAQQAGSVAAPTAGLHFTNDMLVELKSRKVEIARICLHVGGGTFLPVKTDDLDKHLMHTESYLVPSPTLSQIQRAMAEGRPIVAVGTTTLRSLESFFLLAEGNEQSLADRTDKWWTTDLFIRPQTKSDRYEPWAVSGLMTNFHQPYSTLFMLVCALIGFEEARAMYAAALQAEYRLFSYGDSSLLWLR